jgi:large conductance mechanosensitive channel
MFSGFRDFIMRGNVVDLAVAVVIGGAFGTVVASFVADVLTPLLGVFGLPNFAELSFQVGRATVNYGLFLNALLAFILVAAAIYFFVVVPMNRIKGPEVVSTKACTECASDIPLAAKRCPMCTSPQAAA